jgi:hypothetical protein
MAGYNEIKGLRVKYLSADPSNAEDGQVWYNSTSGTLRAAGIGIAAYASSTPLPSARQVNSQGGASQSSGLSIGGSAPPYISNTEHYNGSGWAAGGAYPTTKGYMGSSGPETACLAVGGSAYPSAANGYNGTSWTGLTAAPTGFEANRYVGSTASGLLIAGGTGPGSYPSGAFEYNGSSWTTGGSLPSAGNYGSGAAGTQTAAYSAGGNSPLKSTTANYDGSSWTVSGSLPKAAYNTIGNTVGGQTSGVISGGGGPPGGFDDGTFHYDGSVWAADVTQLANMSNTGSSFGPQSAHVFAGGGSPAISTTQEYSFVAGTVTPAATATGGSLNTARNALAGVGTQTAALMIAGNNPGTTQKGNVESYDGSSYTEINDLQTARSAVGSAGTQTAAVVFGGDIYPSSPRDVVLTEEYSGSTWSEQNDMSTARRSLAGFGTQTAAVAAGGYITAVSNSVEEYDGSSWTGGGALPTATTVLGGTGILTAGLVFGGVTATATIANSYEYDGSSWTAGGSLGQARWGPGRGPTGTQTAALAIGGQIETPSPSAASNIEGYDGTSWSTRPSLATARREGGAGGTSTAAVYSGGQGPTFSSETEEFTGEITTPSNSTITTS